ncbi:MULTISPECIES: hypothetical protein [unclassified Sphingomonas]|uniref:hypothetical protein n=1 Tax=unclassified Sphingomonas TaxID=196159 RepID=UPI0006F38689|nr:MULTISPECIES: hypothetical protein [unclassified Sphingomonas]KQM62174.1 hypothetical protein ASE65_03940 [Sphingomonas sp. Leaf16]KQN13578.1 hypothetical protein ASE81_04010 [Sphingomonas sp. Leaf29]KQN23189.1 hypothetical protein ASE83_01400 [Sphingomonas sp. Leaf32]
MILRRLVLLVCTLSITGCAVPEARLRTGLSRAGLSRPLSACMAKRMADRLSLKQLLRLSDLPAAGDAGDVRGFLHRVRALGDSEILGVASSSAALCASGLHG